MLEELDAAGNLDLEMFSDNKIWVKLFFDSDATSTKIALNIANQPKPNSAAKHPLLLFCSAPDKRYVIQPPERRL